MQHQESAIMTVLLAHCLYRLVIMVL